MAFIDQVQRRMENGFISWFKVWAYEARLKNLILNAAENEKNSICFMVSDEPTDTNKEKEIKNYLSRPRIIDYIHEYLGEGFTVKHTTKTRHLRAFSKTLKITTNYLVISWGNKNEY